MTITVAEAMALPIMQHGVVVAGKKGLSGNVRWVHVSEMVDISRFLKGGELLLTTGMGLSVPPDYQARYIHELAEREVAAVAISEAAWGRAIPQEMIAAAEAVDLPLISFTREVPFVQITEEVHTLIVNRHYAQFRQAEAVARQLNEVALQNQNPAEILRILYQVLKNPVAFVSCDDLDLRDSSGERPFRGEPDLFESGGGMVRSCYPPGDWEQGLMVALAERGLLVSGVNAAESSAVVTIGTRLGRRTVDTLLHPIFVSGQRWGYLAVLQSNSQLTEVERMVVDRASVTLAYEVLRHTALQEKRRGTLAELCNALLSGQVADAALTYQRARTWGHDLENRWFCAGMVQGPPSAGQVDMERRIASACARQSVGYLSSWKAGRTYLLLFGLNPARLRAQLEALAKDLEMPLGRNVQGREDAYLRPVAAFGRILFGLDGISPSRRQAEFTLELRRQEPAWGVGPFFDSTGVHRLLVSGTDPVEVHRFVREELGPLLHLEDAERHELLYSLRVLLDNQLSMSISARILGLSRQTVYQRRSRLEELLQCQLEQAEKALSLGLALRALESEPLVTVRAEAK